MLLYAHLKTDDSCMAAMGGSIEEARRYVDSMKKQESYRGNPSLKINKRMIRYKANCEREKANFRAYHAANKEPRQQDFAAYYEDNIEKVNKKRMEVYEANKETEKAYFRDYHEANKEPRKKYFVDWMKGGWWNWSSQYLTFPLRERSERVGLSPCVKHGHVVQSPNYCWLFEYVHPSIQTFVA